MSQKYSRVWRRLLAAGCGTGLAFTLHATEPEEPAGPGPLEAVHRYYQAINSRDVAVLSGLYSATSQRWTAARLAQRFGAVEAVRVIQALGVQQDAELAHVAVAIAIVARSGEPAQAEPAVAYHDLRWSQGMWRFCAPDSLGDADRLRLQGLWSRQRQLQQADPGLRALVQSIASRQRAAAADREGKAVEVVQ